MSFIRWHDKYMTGIQKFDEQHQRLFSLINELYAGVIACHSIEEEKQITQKTLAELVRYAEEHFGAEEELMQQYSFPHFGDHKHEHELFFQNINKLIHECYSQAGGVSTDVFLFMRDWITKHVTETDIHYVSYFKEHGVK